MLQSRAGLLLAVVFFGCALLYGRIIIEGDGFTYYALTQSLIQDGDFQLRNQRELPDLHLFVSPITRKIASRFSCGFAYLYAPYLLVANNVDRAIPSSANWNPYPQNRTIRFTHSLAIFAGSIGFTLGTLFFCILLLRQAEDPHAISVLLPILVFLGTPLLFYTLTMPSYAHAADSFLVAAAFLLLVAVKKTFVLRNFVLGFLLSFAILLRNNNVAVVPPLALGAAYLQPNRNVRGMIIALLQVLAGAVPGLLLFAQFNITQYGGLFTIGYRIQTAETFLTEMLFHQDAGLFIWAPITAVAFMGLVAGAVRRSPLAVIALSCVLFAMGSIQFQPNWWGGCSFGARLFTHLAVFWVWGLHECWRFGRKGTVAAASICMLWTFFLFNIFFINSASQPFRELLRAHQCRRSPSQMVQNATQEYSIAARNGEVSNPLQFWFRSLGKGKFPTVQYILR